LHADHPLIGVKIARRRTGDALLLKAKALFDADDFDAMHKVLAEHSDTLTELTQLCHKLGGEVARLRPSVETMQ
jgi:hypothetical protein